MKHVASPVASSRTRRATPAADPSRLEFPHPVEGGEANIEADMKRRRVAACILLEYSLSLTKTMYKVQRKILNNQIIN